jgi:ribosomal protein S18 acetylase RimI-like enzyme
MTIEKAISDDDLILTEITKKSKAYWKYSEEQIKKWTNTLTISKDYITQNETYKLILDNRKIAGYYSFIKKENQIIKLDNMFIAPEYIGNGYGKILMNDFIERIKQTKFEKIILDAEPNAKMFYHKFGFTVIGQFESSIKDRFIPIMELKLKE